MNPGQLELVSSDRKLLTQPGPEVVECAGAELLTLDARLKAEGKCILILKRVGVAGWRVTVAHLPDRQPLAH
jgi:hypothetical protein